MRPDFNIPHKANRVLNLILLAFLLILIRVWYLAVIQHDEHVQKARRPQRKTVISRVERATIRDRFNIPMAINKMQYNATVRYADLRQIPSGIWKKGPDGKKYREPVRNVYIEKLAHFLGDELQMDPVEIEDIIHAKASLFPHTPFVVKEDISEKEYYRLRLHEKDWVGMEAQRTSRRIYPQGKVGCDIVGHLGAISQPEYIQIAQESKLLQEYIQKREAGDLVFLPQGYDTPIEARKRLKELQEKAYAINDLVGKTGIESVYDEMLRGFHGKKYFEIDPKGTILRELPCSQSGLSGQRVVLSLSAELQEYAESLLADNEKVRDKRDPRSKTGIARPWIKGGAIVAMDPKTGEVLALASYPRIDPNDFIPSERERIKKQKQQSVLQWIESEHYIGQLWEGRRILEREGYDKTNHLFSTDQQMLTWAYFLKTILPPSGPLRESIEQITTVRKAYELLHAIHTLLTLSEQEDAAAIIDILYRQEHDVPIRRTILAEKRTLIADKLFEHPDELYAARQVLDPFLSPISYNDDKVLVLDLCRLLVHYEEIDESLLPYIGDITLSEYHEIAQSLQCVQSYLHDELQTLHHELGFQTWRQTHFKDYLKQKRKEEKENKKYTQPYTEYLAKVEKALFKEFWTICKPYFLDVFIQGEVRVETKDYPQLSSYFDKILKLKGKDPAVAAHLSKLKQITAPLPMPSTLSFFKAIRSYQDLNAPLWGKYRMLRNTSGIQLEKHLAASFYPLSGFGYGRSQAYRQSAAQGSVFKLAIAYEALKEKYQYLKENHMSLRDLNPLTLVDEVRQEKAGTNQQVLGYTLEGSPIKRFHKGGKLPRSHANIGKIDIKGALEQSSNMYFSYLSVEHIEDPSFLEKATRELGYGSKTGIELPGEISGNIPDDLIDNRTGLYSFAIGQHSLIVTPLQTSVMLSTIANQGKVLKPKIVQLTAGKERIEDPFAPSELISYPFQQELDLVGIHFPLFTEALTSVQDASIHWTPTEVKRELFFPSEIRQVLLDAMQRVINGPKGTARPNIIRLLWENPDAMRTYLDLRYQMVGKTGTAETLYKQWIDAESLAEINNNIWFAGIGFSTSHQEGAWGEPELVVVVYLRFSDAGGKEAAPFAAQMIQKWREIKHKYGKSSFLELKPTDEQEAFENTQW